MKVTFREMWATASNMAKVLSVALPVIAFLAVVLLDLKFKTDVQAAEDHANTEEKIASAVLLLKEGQDNDRIDRFNREIDQIDEELLDETLSEARRKHKENRRAELVALIAAVRAGTY
jgi:hypothetical protein